MRRRSSSESESLPPDYSFGWKPNSLTISALAQQSAYLTKRAHTTESRDDHGAVPWFRLLRFAKASESILLLVGVFLACVNGLFVPVGNIIYGEFTAMLIDRSVMNGSSTPTLTLVWFGGGRILKDAGPEENKKALIEDSVAFGIGCTVFSIFQFIAGAISIDIFNYAALLQINRLKEKFLQAILRQDIAWYDQNNTVDFATKVSDDIEKYREGIAEKVAMLIYLVTSFIFSVVISFFYGWELTLILLSTAPVIIATTAIVAKIQSTITAQELKAYSSAGLIAEEVISSIRTVVTFGGEEKEVQRYQVRLEPAKKLGSKKGAYSGIGSGVMWMIIYATYALAFWYGVGLILDSRHEEVPVYTPAVLMIIFFSVLQGAQNVGLTAPHMEAINCARAAGAGIFAVLDRIPEIDSLSEEGEKPIIDGNLELKDVFFRYPARLGIQVLNGINLRISKNEVIALVGASGCGKTTVLQLLQRMYDPQSGTVTASGHDLRDINVKHLRNHIAVVGQEPVLFAGTIKDNIRLSNPSCTDEDIISAAKQAHCHDFINKLPDGYDTMIDERGAQLSGGQKQRVAIARALVKKPTILLLDEATSALDSHSEQKVQKALNAAADKLTTVMVSHRLATVIDASRIVFLDKGEVKEEGTHEQLIAMKGFYYHLVLENESYMARRSIDLDIQHRVRFIRKKRGSKVLEEEEKKTEPKHLKAEEPSAQDEASSSDSDEGMEAEDERFVKKQVKPSTWQILLLCAPEKYLMLLGVFAAIAVGSSFPTFAVLFGETYGLLESWDEAWVRGESNVIAVLFLLVGVYTGFGIFFQIYIFNLTGVRLTARLRVAAFKHMLEQEIGWFEHPKNGVGALCARLASDAAAVQGATGTRIGALMQASATIIIGIIISMYLTWKMTLVSLVSVPMVMGAVVLEGRVLSAGLAVVREASNRATAIATEAIANIRTVSSLCCENRVLERYREAGQSASHAARKSIRWRGCVYAFGQTAPVEGYALSLWYGGILVANKEVPYKSVITVSEALIFGAWMMGQALAFAPNFGAAMDAAGRVLSLLQRHTKVYSPKAPAVPEGYITEGKVQFYNVKFRYPTRREVEVLRGLSLLIPSGQRVALVGPSGCGKSTLIQLLQRFYDPDNGPVYLDDHNIERDIRLNTLRRNLGVVSQEPVLFDRTIAENIAYGDNTRDVPIEEIVSAAKKANVHSFIAALPAGYETRIGARASQLSGGQKQRIAIARVLIRDPRILLLDEPTSALDARSEKIVQEVLDRTSKGRTCLIIAHRLATIQNADTICVIDRGVVAEKGTHKELLLHRGIYAKLYELQCGIPEEAENEAPNTSDQ